ncbi:hypothetical protein C7B65_26535 [Phormidesmis priestleyi ULC007]|uniref:Uncharacterized protein n=1 Tax=Phormidesmis priestleyi ULC007 TaxID=1920490 RepID=A0A2T1D1K0_9CYAN|nr:hypothetical protein C7B65_26535 [Phormidesmis priestleyi ULC007]
MTLALIGNSQGETEPRKATYVQARHNHPRPLLHWRPFPPRSKLNSGKSLGNPVVEMALPNGMNNLTEGTNKNGLRVKGKSNPE